ncbi:MAG: GNAT family N-acetyltransferase [Proteobacteria bacterium]|nr:GNAT family N-acetyltransferase [Pseudomonadota bacterium]
MVNVRLIDDLTECRHIWEKIWPVENVFDLWDVRACFLKSYNRPFCFIVAEENDKVCGLLALSWVDEVNRFCHFPGEIWKGKTWLEQNKIISTSLYVTEKLIDNIPGPAHVRYLIGNNAHIEKSLLQEDEVGYLFHPEQYQFSFQNYYQSFPGKKRKKLTRELSKLEEMGISYSYDDSNTYTEHLFQMNMERYGDYSYFQDNRFLNAFKNLIELLKNNGWLRVTTVLIGGEIAAIDVGAVLENHYTVLAGGTNSLFPGVAKLINFHHLKYACEKHFEQVDFLCGDFGWKERFLLTPRPLYEFIKS